MSNQQIQ